MQLQRSIVTKMMHHALLKANACGFLAFAAEQLIVHHGLQQPLVATADIVRCAQLELAQHPGEQLYGVYYSGPDMPNLQPLLSLTLPTPFYFFWVSLTVKGVLEVNAFRYEKNAFVNESMELTSEAASQS